MDMSTVLRDLRQFEPAAGKLVECLSGIIMQLREQGAMTNRRIIFLSAAFILLASCVFTLFPLDIMVSSFFYKLHWFYRHGLYRIMNDLRYSYDIVGLIWFCCLFVAFRRKDYFLCYQLMFVLLCFVVGSAIVTPVIKALIGRPRPYTLLIFGGLQQYYAPWVASQACLHNCSFISGEAAFSVQVLLFGWLLHDTRYRAWAWFFSVCYFFLISLFRIMLGRHFLSDVLLAAGVMLMLDALLYSLMFKEGNPRFTLSSRPSYITENE
jgi:lipid A 4'-phosphatase